jgi:hypothetical protein
MNRRSFLVSMSAVGGPLMLRRSARAQDLPPATRRPSSAAEQSEAIRTAASHFVQSLAPERRSRITYTFPSHETPTVAKFSREGPRWSWRAGRSGWAWWWRAWRLRLCWREVRPVGMDKLSGQ